MEPAPNNLAEWLRQKTQNMSLREVAAKTGLSHSTISGILKGNRASPESIRCLSSAFSGNGAHQQLALEDRLLVLANYRTQRQEEALSEPLAELLDKMSQFDESQLRLIGHFVDFFAEMVTK